jgi:CMP-N-acetylneuraminic acid synthetase
MRVLAVIPARGGSKGIPDKNLALLCGRPLLAYTADAVKGSRRITRAIVTTDDARIADCARSLGLDVPFMRPASLAGDDVPMLPVLQHAISEMEQTGFSADTVVLLQPTSPLRRAEHVDAAVDWLDRAGGDSVVSVVEVPHQFNPVSVMRIEDGWLKPFLDVPPVTRRQEKPRVFARNGPAVLVVRAGVVKDGSLYGERSWPLGMSAEDSLDIDTPWDLKLVESVLAARSNANSL